MFDEDSRQNAIIKATLKLAETRPWSSLAFTDIAEAAECSLFDLRQCFSSRKQILTAFFDNVDQAVLKILDREKSSDEDDETPKDRLFDVLMTRFEVLQPYRNALKAITADMAKGRNLELLSLSRLSRSNRWMLEVAGVEVSGMRGAIRNAGLTALYARVIPVWLEDEDPGLAKTMSTLDKRLVEGEKWLKRADAFCDKGSKMRRKTSSKKNEPESREKEAADKPPAGEGRTDNGPEPAGA